jgi:hypothetical protein
MVALTSAILDWSRLVDLDDPKRGKPIQRHVPLPEHSTDTTTVRFGTN